ncbi:hypothetical protein Taro_005095 [Colocasia esculenta]|uniref:VOC domain-containing protein n=1 Tax=Colocasia esculenta TaxID=4460 RepID=A0A843TK46_COLES|nr:hypothetical protein [Colocasia esculenta]
MGLEIEEEAAPTSVPSMALNHVSFVVRSVSQSVKFYEEVLGFVSIKRPSSFRFEGAWLYSLLELLYIALYTYSTLRRLFNYGVGIHLLECNGPDQQAPRKKAAINPKDNHISFQCSDMRLMVRKLEGLGIAYVTAIVREAGIGAVDQLLFHDPDGYMVENCNCQVLPVLPLSSSCLLRRPFSVRPGSGLAYRDAPLSALYGKDPIACSFRCAGEVEDRMMESLVTDIMDISF